MKTAINIVFFSFLAIVITSNGCGVKDIDANTDKSIKIGTQEWMSENLNTLYYRNGNKIPEAKTYEELKAYADENTGAWCYYDNDSANGKKYGKLYNYYAIRDSRGLAPEGWHIPSIAEWEILIDYLGGNEEHSGPGGKLKEKGTAHWKSPNTGATNETNFSALPGGYFGKDFGGIGGAAIFWSSSSDIISCAYLLNYNNTQIFQLNNTNTKQSVSFFSVRCVKD